MKPFEEFQLIKQLCDKGLSVREISAMIGMSPATVDNYFKIARTLPLEVQRRITKSSHNPHDLTVTKALCLVDSHEKPEVIAKTVEYIQKEGATSQALSQKLSEEGSSKLHRVRESRVFWKELTQTLRQFTEYWDQYSTLKEWEEPDAYHLELQVRLPKDVKELKD